MTAASPRRAVAIVGLLGLSLPLLASVPPTRIFLEPDHDDASLWSNASSESVRVPREASPLYLLWDRELPRERLYSFRQAERSTPMALDGRLVLGTSRADGVWEVDPRDGWARRWLVTEGPVEAPMMQEPASGDLIFGDAAGYVYRFTRRGTEVWRHESSGPIVAPCGVSATGVYYPAVDGALVALDGNSGEQRWAYRRADRYASSLEIFGSGRPLVVPGGLVVSGYADGAVVAVREENGQPVWERQLVAQERFTDVDGTPLLIDDHRVLVSAYSGPTVLLEVSTGEEFWRLPSLGANDLPLLHGQTIYLADNEGGVVALEASSGQRLWRFEARDKELVNAPVWWRDRLLITGEQGLLALLDPVSGEQVYRFEIERRMTGFSGEVSVVGDAIYALTDGGYLYALVPRDYLAPGSETKRLGDGWWPWEDEGIAQGDGLRNRF